MLYLEFWKSKQGIWFFDIHRLVFFTPLYVQIFKMQKYPTIATDYLGHIVGFCQKTTRKSNFYEKNSIIHKAILWQSEYLHIYLCHFLSVCEHISPGLNRLLWLHLDLKLSMSYFAVLFFFQRKKVPPFISKYCSHCHILPLTGKNQSQKCFPQILKEHVPNVRLVALGSKDKLHRGFCYRYLETCDSLTKSFTFNLNFLFST